MVLVVVPLGQLGLSGNNSRKLERVEIGPEIDLGGKVPYFRMHGLTFFGNVTTIMTNNRI